MARALQDMVVTITGASSGIGKELAIELARNGAKLSLAARRLELLEQLNASLGGGHVVMRADVANPSECEAVVNATLERFGRIDTLVCNAGYGHLRSIAEMSSEQMRAIFATNVFGTTDCIRAAVPVMSKQPLRDGWRGQIMIVTSAAARRGLPYNGAYSATKAAQLSIAEALRVELRPLQIAVTSVLPIGTATEFFDTAEQVSGRKLDPSGTTPKRHSVQRVVQGMIRAIRRPRGEVWSSKPTRWGLVLNAAFPTLGDRVMLRRMREFEELNRLNPATGNQT